METLNALPGVALMIVAMARDVVNSALKKEALDDLRASLNDIDEYLLELHAAADAARIELEGGDNANRP